MRAVYFALLLIATTAVSNPVTAADRPNVLFIAMI
jgi:hypothetical protein